MVSPCILNKRRNVGTERCDFYQFASQLPNHPLNFFLPKPPFIPCPFHGHSQAPSVASPSRNNIAPVLAEQRAWRPKLDFFALTCEETSMVVHSCFVQSLRFPDVAGRKPSRKKYTWWEFPPFIMLIWTPKTFPLSHVKVLVTSCLETTLLWIRGSGETVEAWCQAWAKFYF